MSPLNIGFVGAGTIARHHADALEELDESITAVADVNLMVLTAFSGTYGAPKTYEDYDRMFADLDAAVVAVPNTLHADCAVAALDADIDVLVEKSLTESSETARHVEAAERESDARVMIRFKKAFDLWFEYADENSSVGEWTYFGEMIHGSREHTRNTLEEGLVVQRVIEPSTRTPTAAKRWNWMHSPPDAASHAGARQVMRPHAATIATRDAFPTAVGR